MIMFQKELLEIQKMQKQEKDHEFPYQTSNY